jgi:hypothetical protein
MTAPGGGLALSGQKPQKRGLIKLCPRKGLSIPMSGYVAFVPYNVRPRNGLGHLRLADMDWPLGTPADLSGTLADLDPDDHVVIYPYTMLHFMPRFGLQARLSLMISEPDIIHRKHLQLLRVSSRRFHRILTRSPFALSRFRNARRFVAAVTRIHPADRPVPTKTAMTSLIASGKRDQTGHRLRHEVVEVIRSEGLDVAVMGAGYAPFAEKHEGLEPFRYSVVIENISEQSYFTEKLIDCCLCRTVPIYWGAPDVGKWFNPDGMVICRNRDEISAALRQTSPEDYAARAGAIEENRRIALRICQTEARAAQVLLSDEGEVPPFA